MPKVGKKHFSYDAKGVAAAKKAAAKSGQKVVMQKGLGAVKKGKR